MRKGATTITIDIETKLLTDWKRLLLIHETRMSIVFEAFIRAHIIYLLDKPINDIDEEVSLLNPDFSKLFKKRSSSKRKWSDKTKAVLG